MKHVTNLMHRNFPPKADPSTADNVVAGVADPGSASTKPATVAPIALRASGPNSLLSLIPAARVFLSRAETLCIADQADRLVAFE